MKPKLYIPLDIHLANKTICSLSQDATGEVGWYHLVRKQDDNSFILYETIAPPKQLANGGTTEIAKEANSELIDQLMARSMEDFLNWRCWTHSHGKLPVNPSGQDDMMGAKKISLNKDWYIRLITNVDGAYHATLYVWIGGLAGQFGKQIAEYKIDVEIQSNDQCADIQKSIGEAKKSHDEKLAELKKQYEETVALEKAGQKTLLEQLYKSIASVHKDKTDALVKELKPIIEKNVQLKQETYQYTPFTYSLPWLEDWTERIYPNLN